MPLWKASVCASRMRKIYVLLLLLGVSCERGVSEGNSWQFLSMKNSEKFFLFRLKLPFENRNGCALASKWNNGKFFFCVICFEGTGKYGVRYFRVAGCCYGGCGGDVASFHCTPVLETIHLYLFIFFFVQTFLCRSIFCVLKFLCEKKNIFVIFFLCAV